MNITINGTTGVSWALLVLVLGTGNRIPGSLPVTRVPGQDPGIREFLLPGCCPLIIVVRLPIWCN